MTTQVQTIESEVARKLLKAWPKRSWSVKVKPAVGGKVLDVHALLVHHEGVAHIAAACIPADLEPAEVASRFWRRVQNDIGPILRYYKV